MAYPNSGENAIPKQTSNIWLWDKEVELENGQTILLLTHVLFELGIKSFSSSDDKYTLSKSFAFSVVYFSKLSIFAFLNKTEISPGSGRSTLILIFRLFPTKTFLL